MASLRQPPPYCSQAHFVPAAAQQITGVPGSPSATTTIDGKQLPPPPAKFGGVIKESAKDSKPLLATHGGAAQARAERAAHHDRRPGLRRVGHVRRRDSDSGDGSHREGGAALHAVPLHGALLADARGAHHRPQPPLGRLWCHRRNVHRLPGVRLGHRARERHDRNHSPGQRLRHLLVRQEPQHAHLPVQRGRTFRPVAGRHGVPVFLRFHGRRDRPVDAVPVPEHDAHLPVGRQDRLQPHHRHGGRGDQVHEQPQCGRTREAVLRLLRARRHPLAAPAEEGVDRQVQGQVRHGLREAARPDLRQPEAPRRDPGEHPAHAVAGRPAEVGLAFRRPQEDLCARGGGVCRLRRVHRP